MTTEILHGYQERLAQNLETCEGPRYGIVAIITDSAGGVGAKIAVALAREGIGGIIGTYPEEEDRREAEKTRMEIEMDCRIEFVEGDMKVRKDRQRVEETLKESFGGQLDLLVLNASCATREVNVVTANAWVDELLPYMNMGGKIVLIQAGAKHDVEESLQSRVTEFTSKGVSFFVVSASLVEDIVNPKQTALIFAQSRSQFAYYNSGRTLETQRFANGLRRTV